MGEPLNVLVVDDDADMRRLLAEVIGRREHHSIVSAESAEQALEHLPVWTFQVAFLDHNLPGMEGLLLGEYLRRSNPDMRIAMVSGTADDKVAKRCKSLGLGFIPKPFDVGAILEVLDEYEVAAQSREAARKAGNDACFVPSFSAVVPSLPAAFGIPSLPARIETRLVQAIKRSLSELRSPSRYSERERTVALSGLLSAQVLGVSLPKEKSGSTLFEEYDRIMRERGRRTEFDS